MTNNKLTDKEIIKALECCGLLHIEHKDSYCNECIFKNRTRCIAHLCDNAIGLIDCLQSENKGLREDYTRVCTERDLRIITHDFIKTEAYKEFAEMLKEKAKPHYFDNCNFAVPIEELDNLLKELVGE